MVELAELGLRFSTDGYQESAKALDRLALAAERASKAIKDLGAACREHDGDFQIDIVGSVAAISFKSRDGGSQT